MNELKRYLLWVLLALTMIIFTGCGGANPSEQDGNGGTTPSNDPVEKTEAIQVYYSDEQLTELVAEEHEITYGSDIEKYEVVIAEMGKPNDEKHIALLPEFKLNEVKKDNDGNLVIDVSGDNVYNMGSSGEDFAIEALKKTLFQFNEVKSIQLVVDGVETDSLMGHVDISKPFTKGE